MPNSDSSTQQYSRKSPAHRVYDALNRWYAALPTHWPETPAEQASVARSLAPDALTGHSGWDMSGDLAWFLLHAASRPLNPGVDRMLTAFWEHVPPLGRWLRYLASFPEGDFCADYRTRRVHKAESALMRVHLPTRWLSGATPLPEAGYKHVAGEWVCLECRAILSKTTAITAGWPERARLRASSDDDTLEVSGRLSSSGGGTTAVRVTLALDGEYLRLWVTPEDSDAGIDNLVCVHLVFRGRDVMAADFDVERDSALGKNMGRLAPAQLSDLAALWLQTIPSDEVNHGPAGR